MALNACCVVSKSLICSKKLVLTDDQEQKFYLGLDDQCPCRVYVRLEWKLKKSLRLKRVRDPLILFSRKNKAVRFKNLMSDWISTSHAMI